MAVDVHYSARCNDLPLLELVQRCAPVRLSEKDSTGMTPLHWAARAGKLAAAQLLLQSGCDPKLLDQVTQR